MMKFTDAMVAGSRHALLKKLSRDTRLIRTEGGFERRPLIEHYDRAAQLIAAVGYGPRVLAACYLHSERLEPHQVLERTNADADIANLVFWARDENSHLPASIRESMFHSKLRCAPHAALSIVCARQISNLESILGLSPEDLGRMLLERCGFEPLTGPLSERRSALSRLSNIFGRGVPMSLRDLFDGCLERLRDLDVEPESGAPAEAQSIFAG